VAAQSSSTWYRTGDQGHLRQDGALYAHGRILSDTQVKVRGFRVELQEVENVLLETAEGALSHAVVTLQSLGENGLLAAHVVFAPDFMSHSHQQMMNYLVLCCRCHLTCNPLLLCLRRAFRLLPTPRWTEACSDTAFTGSWDWSRESRKHGE
jgi:acyl-CoA synthetase (AMP-forming)/AMP-acid ligase II